VAIADFSGTIVPLRVQKREGKEAEQLLTEKDDEVEDNVCIYTV